MRHAICLSLFLVIFTITSIQAYFKPPVKTTCPVLIQSNKPCRLYLVKPEDQCETDYDCFNYEPRTCCTDRCYRRCNGTKRGTICAVLIQDNNPECPAYMVQPEDECITDADCGDYTPQTCCTDRCYRRCSGIKNLL